MAINLSVQYNGGFLPDIILLTQFLSREGRWWRETPVWPPPPVTPAVLPCVMVYNIVSGVLLIFFWCPCMAINVSVQYNGGLLPDIILLSVDPMLFPSGNPFKCHEEVLYLQPLIQPKRFDIFPP